MRFLATIDQGVYIDEDDEFEGVHPDLLDRYYGTDGPSIRSSGVKQVQDIPLMKKILLTL